MTSALLIRLRPAGPWRYGPSEGGLDRVDTLYRSDRLFSAVTLAFARLGMLDDWLDSTARAPQPAVTFSSLFPFQGDTLFVPPPATLWPPPPAALRIASTGFGTKVRWNAARFVPVTLAETLLLGQRLLSEQWIPDSESACLLRRDRPQTSPFRTVIRRQLGVDRLGAGVEPHSIACVEFEPSAGLWGVAGFANESLAAKWDQPLRSAFRLLADTGFGARRSSGWGQTRAPEFQQGQWPAILFPKFARAMASTNGETGANGAPPKHWLLSLFSPAAGDTVDWSNGSYSLTIRGGRIESTAGSGKEKKVVRMVTEGSVIAAPASPVGAAVDVAPDGFPHPVYRSGLALGLRLPEVTFAAVAEEPVSIPEEIPPELIPAAVTDAMIAEDEAAGVTPAEEPAGEEPEVPDARLEPTPVAEQPADQVDAAESFSAPEPSATPDLDEPPASGIGTGREAEQAATPDHVPPFATEVPSEECAQEQAPEPSAETENPIEPESDEPENKNEV